MPTMQTLTPAQRFFYEHAAFSWNPDVETRDAGRRRCAIELAAAEALYLDAHQCADVGILWEHDPDDCADGDITPETRESACLWYAAPSEQFPRILNSLGGICDADDNYRRVIRAELAHECADELRRIVAENS